MTRKTAELEFVMKIDGIFQTLRKFGATEVYIMATHAIFSADSVEIVSSFSDFVRKIVVTNTVPQNRTKAVLADLLHVIDVSGNKLIQ